MAPTIRESHAARVRLPGDEAERASAPSHVIVSHHRAPRVEWSVDVATGGHMLHLALAQCVFNNVMRIARDRGLRLTEASVLADGDFDADGTASTGIDCSIEVAGEADGSELVALAEEAFGASTVVAVLRRGGRVDLASVHATGREAPQPRSSADTDVRE